MASEPAPRQELPTPMPFDLWWSPSLKRLLSRHENEDDEHLVWVMQGGAKSLRHYLGTGLDSNPPLPDDAVRLVLADPAQTTELLSPEVSQTVLKLGREHNRMVLQDRDTRAVLGIDGGENIIHAVRDLLAERDERQARIEAALAALGDPLFDEAVSAQMNRDAIRRARAALAGDQPTPEDDRVQPHAFRDDGLGNLSRVPGTETCMHCGLMRRDDVHRRDVGVGDDTSEPAVTSPDPSGCILDGGPVVPFTASDREVTP